MTILLGGKDVTEQVMAQADARRLGPEGQRQRDILFGILSRAIYQIEEIPPPWLDDYIHASLVSLRQIRTGVPHN